VEIIITDVNDNNPVIQPVGIQEIVESVEGSPVSTNVITRLTVTDSDQFSQFEFSISNNPDSSFSINQAGKFLSSDVAHLLVPS